MIDREQGITDRRTNRVLQLLLLTAGTSAAMYARSALNPLQEIMRTALALSDNQMALLQGSALGWPLLLSSIPIGLLVDRRSRKRILLAFTAVNVGANVLTALTSSFGLLFVARCLVGIASTAVGTAAFSLVADYCAPGQRGRATTLLVIGQFAGVSGAFALGGALLQGSLFDPLGWRWALILLTLPLVLVAIGLLAMREPPRTRVGVQSPPIGAVWSDLRQHIDSIAPAVFGLVLAEVALQALLVWAAPTLSRNFALSPGKVGSVMAGALVVSGIAGPVGGGFLADLCEETGGPGRTMLCLSAMGILSVPATFFAFAPWSGVATVLLIIVMTIATAIVVMGTALITVIVPNELRGLCIAVTAGLTMLIAVGGSPLLVSVLSGQIGGSGAIGKALGTVCACSGILSAVMFIFGARFRARTFTAL